MSPQLRDSFIAASPPLNFPHQQKVPVKNGKNPVPFSAQHVFSGIHCASVTTTQQCIKTKMLLIFFRNSKIFSL